MLTKLFTSILITLGLINPAPIAPPATSTPAIKPFVPTADIVVEPDGNLIEAPRPEELINGSGTKLVYEFVDSTSTPEVIDPYQALRDWEASTTLPWHLLNATSGINIGVVDAWAKAGGFKVEYKLKRRGELVAYLQRMLKVTTDTFKKESVSGYYGPVTEKAVKELQQKFGLKPSGVTEPATRYLLNKFYYNQLCPKPGREFPDFRLADVTKQSALPADYVPADLVNIDIDHLDTRGVLCLRQEAASALQDIFNDANNLNYDLRVTSAFRKIELQKLIVDTTSASRNYVARPGYSEHQLGTAIDITGKGVKFRPTDTGFAKTAEGKWLAENAWRYGFVLSYPNGKNKTTGYNYEPWHIRYLGQDLTQILHERGISYTEYAAEVLKKQSN